MVLNCLDISITVVATGQAPLRQTFNMPFPFVQAIYPDPAKSLRSCSLSSEVILNTWSSENTLWQIQASTESWKHGAFPLWPPVVLPQESSLSKGDLFC